MGNVTAWYSLFLNQPVFSENKFCYFKVDLFSILNTKQINDGIFSNKAGENFNLVKTFLNVSLTLNESDILNIEVKTLIE